MGFFDWFKKKDTAESRTDVNLREGINVSMDAFERFQRDVGKSFSDIREKYNIVVQENHELKRQVINISNRLDEIQREQMKMGLETKKGLSEIKSLASRQNNEPEANEVTTRIDKDHPKQGKLTEAYKDANGNITKIDEGFAAAQSLSSRLSGVLDAPKRAALRPG